MHNRPMIRRVKFLNSKLLAGVAVAAISTGVSAQAVELRDDSIRAAAIANVARKLGTIRGTIAIKDRHIYLTEKMIERLKPVKRNNANEETASIAGN